MAVLSAKEAPAPETQEKATAEHDKATKAQEEEAAQQQEQQEHAKAEPNPDKEEAAKKTEEANAEADEAAKKIHATNATKHHTEDDGHIPEPAPGTEAKHAAPPSQHPTHHKPIPVDNLGINGTRCTCRAKTSSETMTTTVEVECATSAAKYADQTCLCHGVEVFCNGVPEESKSKLTMKEHMPGLCDEVGDQVHEGEVCEGEPCEGLGWYEDRRSYKTVNHIAGGHEVEECYVETRRRSCTNQKPCDCTVSDWGRWSDCSGSCGEGVRLRGRKVLRNATFGGDECPDLVETHPCMLKDCPVDCHVSPWGEWSACQLVDGCGTGLQARQRAILRRPQNGGAECPPLRADRECHGPPCTEGCKLSPWSEWSECSSPCGGGSRERTRTVLSAPLDANCGRLREVEGCNTDPCENDCMYGDWEPAGECSAPCGGGQRKHVRSVLQHATGNGRPCLALFEFFDCNPQKCPEDCRVSEWSEWSDCEAECGEGIQTRTRIVEVHPGDGGAQCPELEEERECHAAPCGTDCLMTQWSPWSECSHVCGGGIRERTRRVLQRPTFGGNECESTGEVETCNTHPCPVDCVVGNWTRWSMCSEHCDGGVMTRERPVLRHEEAGGTNCPDEEEEKPCNLETCSRDCKVGQWGPWSACSAHCGEGIQTRQRVVQQPPAGEGAACGKLIETRTCHGADHSCENACQLSPWSPWSACSKECGSGERKRTRAVLNDLNPANHDKDKCGALEEYGFCNTQPCPQDCVTDQWSDWSQCTQECGGGLQVRTRNVLTPTALGGRDCPALMQTRACNQVPCPQDCEVGEWTDWTNCSHPCGDAVQARSRPMLVDQMYGGKPCPLLYEARNCGGDQPMCPQADCLFSPWSDWSECTAACGVGNGTMFRTRTIESKPKNVDAAKCGGTREEIGCNNHPCPTDCAVGEWGEWGECNADCNGYQVRERAITQPPLHGGRECPQPLREMRDCSNSKKCNVEYRNGCQYDVWSSWGACEATCDGLAEGVGTQRRTRHVKQKGAVSFAGAKCEPIVEERECHLPPLALNGAPSDRELVLPHGKRVNVRVHLDIEVTHTSRNGTLCPVSKKMHIDNPTQQQLQKVDI